MNKTWLTAISCILGAIKVFAGNIAYFTNQYNNYITVYDIDISTITENIEVGLGSYDVVFSLDGSKAYVSSSQTLAITVIDTATHTVTKTIDVSQATYQLTMSPDGTRLYAPNYLHNIIFVIDTDTDTWIDTIDVPGSPTSVAVTPDGGTAYVTCSELNRVIAFDTTTNTLINDIDIEVGTSPGGIVILPSGAKAYVCNSYSNDLSVINLSSHTEINRVPYIYTPSFITISENGMAYVSGYSEGAVTVIDTATDTPLSKKIRLGGFDCLGLALKKDQMELYVATPNFQGPNMFIVDLTTNMISDQVVGNGSLTYGIAATYTP